MGRRERESVNARDGGRGCAIDGERVYIERGQGERE